MTEHHAYGQRQQPDRRAAGGHGQAAGQPVVGRPRVPRTAGPRWHRWGFAAGAAVALAAAIIEYAQTGSPAGAVKTLIAAVIAVAAIGLGATLPGITGRGAVIGALFAAAGIFTWTFTNRPIVIWIVLAVAGIVFAVWGRPWLANLRSLPRLGSAWLGLPYWLFGVAGAVLVGHVTVAGQRIAYAGVFTLAALAVLAAVRRRRGGGDPSVGIAAAIIVATAVLLLFGSGSVFDAVHAVPDNAGAQLMRNRFWGGGGLFFQPNSMAGLLVVATMRIAPDRAFAAWQRLSVTGLACFVLYLTNSRTTFGIAVFVALLHALMVWRWRRADLPAYRRPWVAVLTPFVMLGVVFALAGGSSFVYQSRFSDAAGASAAPDVTSGRIDTWKQVATDWEHAGLAEKIFGDARTSRAVVTRANDGAPAGAPPAQLNTDNAAVGAFRRGGVLGLLAFAAGVLLLLWRALRYRSGGRPPASWFTIAVIGTLPTMALEDWLLGGTNGSIWMLLLAGEACLLWAPSGDPADPAQPVGPAQPAGSVGPAGPGAGRVPVPATAADERPAAVLPRPLT